MFQPGSFVILGQYITYKIMNIVIISFYGYTEIPIFQSETRANYLLDLKSLHYVM